MALKTLLAKLQKLQKKQSEKPQEFGARFTSVGNFFNKLLSIGLSFPLLLLIGGTVISAGAVLFVCSTVGSLFSSEAKELLAVSGGMIFGGIGILLLSPFVPFYNLADFIVSCGSSIASLFKTKNLPSQQPKNVAAKLTDNSLIQITVLPPKGAASSYSTTPLFACSAYQLAKEENPTPQLLAPSSLKNVPLN